MTLHKKLLYLFAATAMLASCSSDKTDSEAGPANVQKLETPKNGLSVSMLLLNPAEFEGLRFEWQPAAGNVSYELAFDKSGGDFSAPVASFETTENNYTLQLEELQTLFDENVDEAGEAAVLDWRVYTLSNAGRTPSTETRTLTLTTRAEVVVETLIAPEKDAVLNLKELSADVDFSWSKPVWLGDEKQISYTLVIDQADKDFAEPLLSIDVNPTSETAAATQATVTREQLAELYNDSEVAATEDPYYLQWAVYARIDQNVKISEEIRTFSIIPQVKLPEFVDGDPLYIEGEGTEAGQKMSYITANSYNLAIGQAGEVDAFKDQDYKYEIFTRIEGGSKFCFRSQPSNTIYTLSADGTKIQAIETEEQAQAPVTRTGIYRIRFNIATGSAYVAEVTRVEHVFCWTSQKTELTYEGKGIWAVNKMVINIDRGGGSDERYKFNFVIDGVDQPYGRMENNGERPHSEKYPSVPDSYWYLQPSLVNTWDPAFKYSDKLCDPNDWNHWAADLRLYMNDDKGHYTHEFVNPVELTEFVDGDPLYIEGEGSEAGQEMAYISGSYYNPGIDNAGGEADAFKNEDYKYEIFTRIEGGSKFYFRSEFSDALYTLSADGGKVQKIDSPDEAQSPIAQTGIYRIRFNISSGKAYVASVDKAVHFFCWTSEETEMTYEGKGVWVIDDLNIKLQKTDWGFDERYKFKLIISGVQQYYGRMDSNGDRPNASTAATYRYVQPGVGDQWATSFKYPDELCDGNDLDRWYTDLRLYMNVEKGHYTHEFTNAHE